MRRAPTNSPLFRSEDQEHRLAEGDVRNQQVPRPHAFDDTSGDHAELPGSDHRSKSLCLSQTSPMTATRRRRRPERRAITRTEPHRSAENTEGDRPGLSLLGLTVAEGFTALRAGAGLFDLARVLMPPEESSTRGRTSACPSGYHAPSDSS